MPQVIDTKVVEMKFNNKDFKDNAQESISILEKLKNALNINESAKSLEKINESAKGISLDNVFNAVEKLNDRFSLLGVAASRVVENIVDGLMNKVGSAVNYVSDKIISGGWKRAMNVETAHFQLQALLNDEAEVQAIMKDASDSVTGTAYAYDLAAKAASSFAATGIKSGEEMQRALGAVTGVTAMTQSDYESISRIFMNVAGNGRLMGDQLLQFSARGLNAAATMSDFFNKVNDGSVQTTQSVATLVKTLSKGAKITEADIREMVSDGLISFELFATAMDETFGDAAFRANETFNGALANIGSAFARIGEGFFSPLIAQNSEVVRMFNSIRVAVNTVKSTLVFNEEVGNVKALSKQFSDAVLKMAGSVADFVDELDIYTPMRIVYKGVESIKNVIKGLLSVLKPVGKAFSEVFLSFGVRDILQISIAVEKLTQKFKMSEKNAQDLHDAFKGIFDVIKLVINAFLMLFKAQLPVSTAIGSLGDAFLELAGFIGRSLTKFTEWINDSKILNRVFDELSIGVTAFSNKVADVVDGIKDFVKYVYDLYKGNEASTKLGSNFEKVGGILASVTKTIVGKVVNVKDSIKDLYTNSDKYLNGVKDFFKRLGEGIKEALPETLSKLIERVREGLSEFWDTVKHIDFTSTKDALTNIKDAFVTLFDRISNKDGIKVFGKNISEFFSNIGKGINFTKIFSNLSTFKDHFNSFITWVKNTLVPFFSDMTASGLLGTATGFGIIYAVLKLSEALRDAASAVKGIDFGGVFGGVKKVLTAYAKEIDSQRIINIAKAIAILAGALVLLSFTDLKAVLPAAILLGAIGIALVTAFKYLDTLRAKDPSIALRNLTKAVKGFSTGFKRIATGIKWASIGVAIALMGVTLRSIVKTITSFVEVYQQNSSAVIGAAKIIGLIGAGIVAAASLISYISGAVGLNAGGIVGIGFTVLAMGMAIKQVVGALEQIFELEFPQDYKRKIALLKEIFISLVGLDLVLTLVNGLVKGSGKASLSILALVFSVRLVIGTMEKLFNMEFPENYKDRLQLLIGVFTGLIGVVTLMGLAARISGGQIKAGGTIIAMCIAIGVIVAALYVLKNLEKGDLVKGATTLGAILIALSIALAGAGASKNDKVYKTVIAMAITIGVIVVALSVLSMISSGDLLKGAVALGSLLLTLGASLAVAGKFGEKAPWQAIIAMTAMVGVIALSLNFLSDVSWGSLLAGAVAMSGVLLALSGVFVIISKTEASTKSILNYMLLIVPLVAVTFSLKTLAGQPWGSILAGAVGLSLVLGTLAVVFLMISSSSTSVADVGKYLLLTTSVIAIALALTPLADKPWSGLLAGATGLSLVLVALGACFAIIDKTTVSVGRIGTFLLACVSIGAIAAALYFLADKPWDGLLTAATALSIVLGTMTVCFFILGKADPDLAAIGLFATACASTILIAIALEKLAELPLENLAVAAASLTTVLLGISAAVLVASVAGKSGAAGYNGILMLVTFVGAMTAVLVALGALFEYVSGLEGLLDKGIEILTKIGNGLGQAIGAIVGGIGEGITASLPIIADNLSNFITKATPFFTTVTTLDTESIKTKSADIAEIIGGFTFAGVSFGDVAQVGADLSLFMINASPFFSALSTISADTINSGLMLSQMMENLTSSSFMDGISKFLGMDTSLSDFGAELAAFGPAVSEFAASVENVSSEQVEGAAAACDIMAAAAKNLPAQSGLATKIFGEHSLAEFADELDKFGPSIVNFSTKVAGVDPSSVEGAAAACNIMSAAADNLPESGGLAQKIFGEHSLSEFGTELLAFGPSIVTFANRVKDVDSSAVEGAAAACNIMSVAAKNLPETGGLAQKIFGEHSLSTFATELLVFGPSIVAFANRVKDVDPSAVEGAAAACDILSTMADNLPETSSLWEKIFGGGTMSLSAFAEELNPFGLSMKTFSDNIAGFDGSSVSAVVEAAVQLLGLYERAGTEGFFEGLGDKSKLIVMAEDLIAFGNKLVEFSGKAGILDISKINDAIVVTEKLVELADFVNGKSSQSVVDFVNKLAEVALDAIDNFADALTGGSEQIEAAVAELFGQIGSSFEGRTEIVTIFMTDLANSMFLTFQTTTVSKDYGGVINQVVSTISKTIYTGKADVARESKSLCSTMYDVFKTALDAGRYRTLAKQMVDGISDGIRSRSSSLNFTVTSVLDTAFNKAKATLSGSAGQQIGYYFVMGIARGIQNNQSSAISAAVRMATNIVKQTRAELGIRSPSTEGEEIGMYYDKGVTKGVETYTPDVYRAIRSLYYQIGYAAGDGMTTAGKKTQASIDQTTANVVSSVDSASAGVVSSVSDTVSQVMEYILQAVEDIRKILHTIATDKYGISIDISTDHATDAVGNAVSDINNSLANGQKNVTNTTADLGEMAENGMTSTVDAVADNTISKVDESIDYALSETEKNFIEKLKNALVQMHDILEELIQSEDFNTEITITPTINYDKVNTSGITGNVTGNKTSGSSIGSSLATDRGGYGVRGPGSLNAIEIFEREIKRMADVDRYWIDAIYNTEPELAKIVDGITSGTEQEVEQYEALLDYLVDSGSQSVKYWEDYIRVDIDLLKTAKQISTSVIDNTSSMNDVMNGMNGLTGSIKNSSSSSYPQNDDVEVTLLGGAWTSDTDFISSTMSEISNNISRTLTSVQKGLDGYYRITSESTGTSNGSPTTNNFNITQNNTSPKALSASDIYNDTASLFSNIRSRVRIS